MASTIADIIGIVRSEIRDSSVDPYWTDQQLARLVIAGIKDLWRSTEAINDHYQMKIVEDDENDADNRFCIEPKANYITGVPDDVYKIRLLEPKEPKLTLPFYRVQYDSIDSYVARAEEDIRWGDYVGQPNNSPGRIYYSLVRSGTAPTTVGSATAYARPANPAILLYPSVSTELSLRMSYVPTLQSLVSTRSTLSGQGRTTLLNTTFDISSATSERFIKVVDGSGDGLPVPTSLEGQISFGFDGTDGGSTISPIFEWRAFNEVDPAAEGDIVEPGSTIAVTFPISHPGAAGSGNQDYEDKLIDITNVTLGKNGDNELLIAFDSQLAITTLNMISPFLVYNIRRESRVNQGLGEVNLDAPIPLVGEPDHALFAWTMAFALARQQPDRTPNSTWLQVYSTEKSSIVNSLVDEASISNTASDASVYQANQTNVDVFVNTGSLGNVQPDI